MKKFWPNNQIKKDIIILLLACFSVSVSFMLYARTTRGGMDSVYRAWDGPSYVIAAQSLYVPEVAVRYNSIQSPEIRSDFTFLPAHFPLYPLLIRAFSAAGYYQSMLALSLIASFAACVMLYFLARRLKLKNPLLLTLPLLMLPPRWFIISHTGSSEPLFLLFVLGSLYLYFGRRPLLSACLAGLAMLTRPQGALLGLAFALISLVDLYRTRDLQLIIKRYSPYLLIPAALLAVFWFYERQTGDFWAFFSAISIFRHFQLALYPTFNYGALNIETFWLETNAIYYFVGLSTILTLLTRRQWQLGLVAAVFYLPLLFIQHTDIARYSIPLVPFVFIAYSEVISTRTFNIAALLSLPMIYVYTANFILFNRAP